MTLEEIELGQEVVCTSLRDEVPVADQAALRAFRGIGHIGVVTGIFTLKGIVFVAHIESNSDGYVELVTAYFVDELSPYTPEVTPLQLAIQKNFVQITRE